MVRTFCDRCGRVIAGASKLGGATVRAAEKKVIFDELLRYK